MSKLRINVVRSLIELNESLVFNRRLSNFYKKNLGENIHTIVDVGANEGQTIDLFLKLNPNCDFFCFEPNPTLFEKLTNKYLENPNIRLYQLGVSDTNGERVFFENVLHSTSSFEEVDMDSEYLERKANILGVEKKNLIKRKYPVKIVKLSSFINAHCSSHIDILKLDTEGHEYACLQGLFDQKLNVDINYIQLEEHNDDMYLSQAPSSAIHKLLEEHNYKVVIRIKHGFGNIVEVIYKKDY